MLKKAIFSILAGLVVFTSFVPNIMVANAATPAPVAPSPAPASWYNQDFQSWFSKVYDDTNPNEIFGERYTAAQVQWIIYSILAFIVNQTANPDIVSCLLKNSYNIEACKDLISAGVNTTNLAQKEPESEESLISKVFAPRSFSGITYIRNTVANFSIVPVAHAQQAGFGFDALMPIQEMWRYSRDMAFALFVVAAIIFAFMIMFRVKISPQVVISVQSAVPKLIISLVLVTFSYAIAGLLIDLMYVVYGAISVMGQGWAYDNPTSTFDFLTRGEIGVAFGSGPDLGVMGLYALYIVFFALAFIVSLFFTVGILGGIILGIGTAILAPAGPLLITIGILLLVVIAIMIIWNGIKIIFSLIKAFANILLLTIFAPLMIVAGTVIPSMGFGNWVKSFVSNLAVFVVTSVLFLFSYIFLIQAMVAPFTGPWFDTLLQAIFGAGFTEEWLNVTAAAPMGGWPPLLGGGDSAVPLLFCGVSFILYTLIPKATEVVQGLVSGRPYAYGTAIGEAFGVPAELSGVKTRIEGARRKYGEERSSKDIDLITKYIDSLKARANKARGKTELPG